MLGGPCPAAVLRAAASHAAFEAPSRGWLSSRNAWKQAASASLSALRACSATVSRSPEKDAPSSRDGQSPAFPLPANHLPLVSSSRTCPQWTAQDRGLLPPPLPEPSLTNQAPLLPSSRSAPPPASPQLRLQLQLQASAAKAGPLPCHLGGALLFGNHRSSAAASPADLSHPLTAAASEGLLRRRRPSPHRPTELASPLPSSRFPSARGQLGREKSFLASSASSCFLSLSLAIRQGSDRSGASGGGEGGQGAPLAVYDREAGAVATERQEQQQQQQPLSLVWHLPCEAMPWFWRLGTPAAAAASINGGGGGGGGLLAAAVAAAAMDYDTWRWLQPPWRRQRRSLVDHLVLQPWVLVHRCGASSEAAAGAGGAASRQQSLQPLQEQGGQQQYQQQEAPVQDTSADFPTASLPPPPPSLGFVAGGYDVTAFPPDRIRNFSIIAHVDHGKSTLADRLMEMTGALGSRATHNAQYLDKLQVERERGITVKAQTVSLVYEHKGVPYLLNLIDTPGHVDFSYEVSRSLAACQGALLVVDAGQGIQAQTVANFYLAFEQGMDLIPVVNKVDLPAADPTGCAEQMAMAFDLDPGEVLFTSAKTGQGMQGVLPAVVERIRHPGGSPSGPLRMLLFDAFHDEYRGVVLLVEVVDGRVEVGMRVAMASTGMSYEVQEVGVQAPERHPTGRLLTGQVGYLLCGIKDLKATRVGDTLFAAAHHDQQLQHQHQHQQQRGGGGGGAGAPPLPPPRLPGFRPAKAMVFAGLFPLGGEGQEFESLATAMDKLLLNDASVVVKRENSEALGPGFRCGFLGMLHMEIFTQRLQQEYGASVVTTTPMVPYVLEMPDGTSRTLESASEYPTETRVSRVLEPTVTATIICPDTCLGRLMELCAGRRGEQLEHSSLGSGRSMLRYRLPLAELAGDFYSLVKSRSQGYASFDYEEGPYRPADLVRLDILAHGKPVDALARMVAREEAATIGRALLAKMKDLLDRQQFEVVLQAAANGKIIARETLKALRKNVTAKCYGGDVTRKRKLLDRQKEGKRRMKRLGSIDVPQELFPELMKTR